MENNIAQDFSDENKIEEKNIKEANQQAVEKAQRQVIQPVRAIGSEDHFLGNLDASIQIIVYGDFNCPFSAKFYDTVNQVKEEFSDNAVIAFRHYPLIGHVYAMPAAIASECAAEQGKFWEMYGKLFENNKESKLNIEQFKKNALEIGIDVAKFSQCLEAEKYKDKIYVQMNDGKDYGVGGSPTIFVNGEPLPGAYPFEDFVRSNGDEVDGMKSIIERHLAGI
ncbi:thioredoxin domain-containing protein [Candidatus Parcubacteria bacterium]|nr:thioredoxin domain-containing protein [Candidatus Parcubacteria bacterium]